MIVVVVIWFSQFESLKNEPELPTPDKFKVRVEIALVTLFAPSND